MDVKLVAEFFRRLGRKWKIGGILRVPSEDDLVTTLDKARETLYAEPIHSSLEVGGLLVRRVLPHTFEVYVYVGDLPHNPKEK